MDWTPEEGMLIEVINSGKCFRLGEYFQLPKSEVRESGHPKMWVWKVALPIGAATGFRETTERLLQWSRPRYLHVGDVIEKIEWDNGSISKIDETITEISNGCLQTGNRYTYDDKMKATIHIRGLGPVPWPPREKEQPMGRMIEISEEDCRNIGKHGWDSTVMARVSATIIASKPKTVMLGSYEYTKIDDCWGSGEGRAVRAALEAALDRIWELEN